VLPRRFVPMSPGPYDGPGGAVSSAVGLVVSVASTSPSSPGPQLPLPSQREAVNRHAPVSGGGQIGSDCGDGHVGIQPSELISVAPAPMTATSPGWSTRSSLGHSLSLARASGLRLRVVVLRLAAPASLGDQRQHERVDRDPFSRGHLRHRLVQGLW